MLTILQKPQIFAGCAIQQNAITMVKLKKTKIGLQLEEFAQIILPITTKPAKKLSCRAAFSLPFSQLLTKRIEIPSYLNDVECHAELTANLQDYFPAINESLHIDFLREETTTLFAARSKQVIAGMQMLKRLAFDPVILDVDIYALKRAVEFAAGDPVCCMAIQQYLQTEFQHNPFERLTASPTLNAVQLAQGASQLLIAFGLALRGFC